MSGRSNAGTQQTGVVATFTGSYDPATGKLSIEAAPPDASQSGALTVFLPFSDGTVGTGPVNSFEIVTDPGFAATVVANDCSGQNAFEGDVTIRSFFKNQSMKNVYAEITGLSPSGHAACNPDPVSGTLTNLLTTYGVWSYGNLDPDGTPSVVATRRWKFRYASDEKFTFQGKIWATLAAPVPRSGDPEFNWYATSLVDPPRTFKPRATTVSHIVWNGSGWDDLVGGAAFVKQGTGGGSVSTGISDTVQRYATFSSGEYWTFTPTGAATTAFELAGDFTVCAKFKPGVLPPFPHPPDHIKTLFAKNNPTIPAGHVGWALMEMNGLYCFHYGTPTSNGDGTELMSAMAPNANPETFAYDYICGGRAGNFVWVGIEGLLQLQLSEQNGLTPIGSFAGTNLPLAIGAMADGTLGADDAGVYEIIIDSRPPVPGVLAEIVGVAEGRVLPGMVGGVATIDTVNASSMATYVPSNGAGTPVTGADGNPYTLPQYATVPLATDGTGLLPAGTVVWYSHLLTEDTRTSGFCLGAELEATGSWSAVHGALFGLQSGDAKVGLFAPHDEFAGAFVWNDPDGVVFHDLPSGWAEASAHVFHACVDPSAGSPIALYADGAAGGTGAGPLPNLSDPSQVVSFGNVYLNPSGNPQFNPFGSPLTGARIRRVFACPNPNPASCK